MKNRHLLTIFPLLMTVVLFGFACKSVQSDTRDYQPKETEKTLTKVTKENLKSRLAGKDVKFIDERSELPEIIKPNPYFLFIKLVRGGAAGKSPLKVTLNREDEQGVDELVTLLRSIFSSREENGVFQDETNEIEKRINIAAGDDHIKFYNDQNIYVEDFEKLIDDLHEAGIDKLYIDFDYYLPKPITMDDIDEGDDSNSQSSNEPRD